MRVLVQRVSEARVTVDGQVTGQIGRGLVLFAGFKHGDTKESAGQLGDKITRLRIFPDNEGREPAVLFTGGKT
jgi:D-aminoacyl-tRNA deacylase